MNGPAVVVMNTHYSGLAIARALAPLGVRVVGVTAVPSFPGNHSRFMQYRAAPDSAVAPLALLDALRRLAAELSTRTGFAPLLFPTRDHDLNFINTHRSSLEAWFTLPLAPASVIERVMNKSMLAEVAQGCGIEVPRSVLLRGPRDLDQVAALGFPCIVKPLYASQWRRPGIWDAVGRRKAVKVESLDELRALYFAFARYDPLATAQQWVEGGEEDLLIFGAWCDRSSEVRGFFTARKRLQTPPLAGTGVVVQALPLPALEAPSRRLLSALRFQGLCEIEYKRDATSGRLKLIEINPRPWDQHGLGYAVGVNLCELAYAEAAGRPLPAMKQQTEPVNWIAEAEYVRHLLSALRARRGVWPALSLLRGRSIGAVHDSADWGPTWALLRSAATALWQGLVRRLPRPVLATSK